MPEYEFRCAHCHTVTTVFVRSAKTLAAPSCSKCGSNEVAQIFTSFAFHGSGGKLDQSDPMTRRMTESFKQAGLPMPKELSTRLEAIRDGEA